MLLPSGMAEKWRTGAREKRGRPYTPSKKGEGWLGTRFFLGGATRGGGGGRGEDFSVTVLVGISSMDGRESDLRVTVLIGMSSMVTGRSERGGGGACVAAFGREIRGQCLTRGPERLEEDIRNKYFKK